MRDSSLGSLQDVCRSQFSVLTSALARKSFIAGGRRYALLPFETFRGRIRQNIAYREGRSRAMFGQSPHNYGLAVDYVFKDDRGEWQWKVPEFWWDTIDKAIEAEGFSDFFSRIPWDKPHVEVKLWKQYKE